MARGGKAADLRAAKERKQKKIAIIGGILLVAILAFQVPRTMKMLSSGDTPPPEEPSAVASPTPAGPVTLEPPTLAGGAGTAAPASSGGGNGLSAEPAPLAAAGQLVSFSHFESKDPFAQQVGAAAAAPDKPSVSGGTKAPEQPVPDGGAVPSADPAMPLAAVISIDGTAETVAPGKDFPAAAPLFRLVSVTKTTAAIAIADGSYADGASTVKLRRGKSLTLMNTADGTRYELKLVSFIWGSAPES